MDDLHPLDRSLKVAVEIAQHILAAIPRPTEMYARLLLFNSVTDLKDTLLRMQRTRLPRGKIPYGPLLFELRQRAHAIFQAWESEWNENIRSDFEQLIVDIDRFYQQPVNTSTSTKSLP